MYSETVHKSYFNTQLSFCQHEMCSVPFIHFGHLGFLFQWDVVKRGGGLIQLQTLAEVHKRRNIALLALLYMHSIKTDLLGYLIKGVGWCYIRPLNWWRQCFSCLFFVCVSVVWLVSYKYHLLEPLVQGKNIEFLSVQRNHVR